MRIVSHSCAIAISRLWGALLGLLILVTFDLAKSDTGDLSPVRWGHWPEYSRALPTAVACEGTTAVVAAGAGDLHWVDFQNPRSPRRVAGLAINRSTNTAVQLVDGIAYVTGLGRGIWLVDGRNPRVPRRAGFYDAPAGTLLGVGSGFFLMQTASNRVDVVSSLDPDQPRRVGTFSVRGAIEVITLHRERAYVVDAMDGLRAFTLIHPEAPVPDESVTLPFGLHALEIRFLGDDLLLLKQNVNGGFFAHVITPTDLAAQKGTSTLEVPPPLAGFPRVTERGDKGWAAFEMDSFQGLMLDRWEIERSPADGLDNLVRRGRSAFPGQPVSVARCGSILVSADTEGRIRFLDVSNPSAIAALSDLDLYGDGLDFAFVGTRALVADGVGGFRILDLSDPGQPASLGRYTDGIAILGVIPCSDGTLLTLNRQRTVRRLEISDPSTPRPIGPAVELWTATTSSRGLFFRNGYLYAPIPGAIQIVDWRDSASPRPSKLVRDDRYTNPFGSGPNEILETESGRVLWVGGGQIMELDFSDPEHPTVIRSQPGFGGRPFVSIQDGYAVSGGGLSGWFSTYSGIDAPFGSTPIRYPHAFASPRGLLLSGDRMLVATGQSIGPIPSDQRQISVEVFSADPTRPVRRLGGCVLPIGLSAANGFRVSNGFLYVLTADGLTAFRLEAPASLTRTRFAEGFTNEAIVPPGIAVTPVMPFMHFVANEDRVAATASYLPLPSQSGFAVLRPEGASNAVVEGATLEGVSCFGLAVTHQTAWVTAGANGLFSIDLSNPTRPRVMGSIPIEGFATNVVLFDGFAYVAARSGGVSVVDIRQPAAPSLVARNGAIYSSILRLTPEGRLFSDDVDGSFSEIIPCRGARAEVSLEVEREAVGFRLRVAAGSLEGRTGKIQRSGDGVNWFNWRPLNPKDTLDGWILPGEASPPFQFFRVVEP